MITAAHAFIKLLLKLRTNFYYAYNMYSARKKSKTRNI